jgi:hypothetical protein
VIKEEFYGSHLMPKMKACSQSLPILLLSIGFDWVRFELWSGRRLVQRALQRGIKLSPDEVGGM